MDLAQRRNDGGRQRRGLRRAVQVAVGLAVPARQRSVDLRAGGSEVDARRAPVRPGRRLKHAGRGVCALGQLQGGHGERAAQLRRHVDGTRHVALVRAPGVAGSRVVGRGQVVQVRREVTGGHHVDDVLRGRVVDRALHGLLARGLLGIVGEPVLPRVHVVRTVGDRDAVVGGPHEAAHDVLGVEESAVARGHVDRGDAQGRVHAVHAHAVVLRGDRAGHVRAVGRVVPAPRGGVAIRDAVERAGHGLIVVDLSDQVRHGVIDGLVHDAHRDGRAHDVHSLRLEGAQGLEVPSVAGLRVRGEGRILIALRSLCSLGARRGRERRVRRDSRLVGDGHHGLVTADGRLAGRADRVVADALLHERRAQVGREGGRCRLHEERAEGRVLGEDESSQERGLGRRALEGGVIGALGQVDRVVGGQLVVAARGGGDAGFGGARRRGSRVGVGRGGRGHGGVRVARDGEDGLAARVIIGLAIEVDACGADLDAGGHRVRALGQQRAEVHVFDRGTQGVVEILARAVAVDGGQAGNVHVQVADRGDCLGVEGDGTSGQSRTVHVLPLALTDPVLQGLDGRLGLVAAHGGQRVDEAVAAEFLAVLGRFQARVFHGGLLAHEVGDLLALEARVDRLNECGDTRDVGRGHRGAAGLGVTGGEDRRGHGRVDVLARRGEVDALAVVGEVGALEVRPLRLRLDVGARGGADLADALDRGRDLHAVLHGAVLDRGVEVGRRSAVGRHVVVVHAIVAR